MKKKLLFAVCALLLGIQLQAQTLSAGDIAIIGYNYDASPQEMSIVTLVNITAGTTIRITDYGYDETTGTFGTTSVANVNEGCITWTTTAAIPSGTVIKFTITSGTTPSVNGLPGTVAITGWTNATATSSPVPGGGDNWFIFQGSSPTSVSTFIFAFTNPLATAFNSISQPSGQFLVSGSGSPSNQNSYLPPSLTLGTTAISLSGSYHGDNNVYKGTLNGTKGSLLAAICTISNWTSNETTTYDITPGGTNFPGTNPVFSVTPPCSAPTSPIITGSNSICTGGSTSFTASATGTSGTTTYSWTYPNSTTATGATISNVTLAGTYTCVISNGTGCTATATTTLTINPTVTPTITISSSDADNTICAGTSVTFTASITNGGTTPAYQWRINGNNVSTATAATFTTTTLAHNDIVTCVLTSNATCATPTTATSTGITNTVNALVTPTITISSSDADNTICSGTSVTFTASITNGGTTPAYQWKINGNNVSTATAATFTTTTLANNDVVTCVLTSNATCATPTTATSTGITNTVNALVTPTITISSSDADNTICAGTSVTFTASITNGGTTPAYQWKINGNNVSTATAATFTTTTLANNDVVTCVLTSNATCATPTTATSTGITNTVNALVTPTITISSSDADNTICAGTSVTFTANITNGGTTPTYQWKINGNNVSTATAATFTTTTLANNDVVTCVLTSNATCATPTTATSTGITNTVNALVTPTITISSSDADNTICAGTSVTFTASITNGGTTPAYQWKINGNNVSTATAATFTTTTLAHNDIVTCVLTSNATCASTTTATSTGITTAVALTVTPTISISSSDADNTICAGTSVTFTASITNGGTTPAYQWKINGNNVSTATAATFTTTTLANNDVVTCVLTSNATCATPTTATSTGITVKVNPVLTPSVSISTPKTTICTGTSVTFTAAPTNGGTTPAYQWKINGNNVNTATAATFTTGTLANNDVVTCVLTSNATCASASTATSTGITMKVNALPTAIASASPNAVCQGDTSILSVVFTGTGPWSFSVTDGTNTTSGVSPNSTLLAPVAPTSTKTYTLVSVSDVNCAGTVAGAATITVKNPSTHTQSISICAGEVVKVGKSTYTKSGNYTDVLVAANGCDSTVITNLTVAPVIDSTVAVLGATLTANEAGATYQWKSCTSNQNISGAISQSYNAVNSGQYAVIVTKGVCSKTSACVTVLVTGIDDSNVSNATLSVYPNPSNGSITISANEEGTYKLQDELGQVTETFNLNAANEFSIVKEGLEAGVYILSGFNNNRMTTQKIVVVR